MYQRNYGNVHHFLFSRFVLHVGVEGGTIQTENPEINGEVTVEWNALEGEKLIWVNEFVVTGAGTNDETICEGRSDTTRVQVFQDSAFLAMERISVAETNEVVEIGLDTLNTHRYATDILLERKPSGSNDWQTASQVAPTDHVSDANPAVANGSWQYRVSAENLCGENLTDGLHQTIFLSGTADDVASEASLSWTPYKGFEVAQYELWRRLDEATAFERLDSFGSSTQAVTLGGDVTLDGFVHVFRIKAVSEDGRESWSNAIQIGFDHPITIIPNVFTPNGDAYNPYFIVPKAELYPNNELVITNRWGKEVFRQKGYRNTWDGDKLPTGVYFYQFTTQCNAQVLKGTLHLIYK